MTNLDISEKGLETILVTHLRDIEGYEQGHSHDFDTTLALDRERVKRFLLATQPGKVENTACFASALSEQKFFKKLSDDLGKHGITYMLRKGFRYLTELFDLYYPLPSELNPTAQKLYAENIFCVTRQLFYQPEGQKSIDVMLSLNGMPVMTIELKNHYTKETIEDALYQYRNHRDPKESPLLAKGRCAVHLAVDDDEIMMCTELKGSSSWFLPFNQGVNGGAGNPNRPDNIRTAYLWEEILPKHSLSDILENYAQIVNKTERKRDPKTHKMTEKKKTVVIWPRYHQLDAVRKLLATTRAGGVGQRFLIQHSAGSGKSNSMTWLAYQLVTLLNGTTPLFDSVIVVTDRVNLDQQIRDNINDFKRLTNIVDWADSSQTLKKALDDGKKIIITIVHKFPYILQAIGGSMKNKRFAIIIDEAHSSQNGSLSAKMNMALSGNVSDEEEDLEDKILAIIEGRKMLKNANYYAFTATPKNKTLQMFGVPVKRDDGETGYQAFHEYTMKQAIEEGFILDVLKNYTTYSSFYKLVKTIADDPVFDNKKAQSKLRAYVESRPETIHQKATIIVEHFLSQVIDKGKVNGQARAMVVTSSIRRAIDFYYEINDLLEKHKSRYRAIVAFSGKKQYDGREVTEADVNGFPSKDIEDNMEIDPYRILVVANKFQTGYDQPLLHTMYVDKVLADVKAVQTLSRLNRCHPYKRDTFVLDFANDTDDIQAAFQRYYKETTLSREADPNKLNDLLQTIEETHIYTQQEVDLAVKTFFCDTDRRMLDPIINKAVDRFKALEEEDKIACKSAIKSFLRFYPFIAAVTPLVSQEWEKLETYYSLLVTKLPVLKGEDFTKGLTENIDLDKLQVVKKAEAETIRLIDTGTEIEPTPVGGAAGTGGEPEMTRLSDILDQFNKKNWKNKELAKKQLEELPTRLQADQTFVNAAKNSNEDTAKKASTDALMKIVAQMLSEHSEFCTEYLREDPTFRNFINDRVFQVVYSQYRNSQ